MKNIKSFIYLDNYKMYSISSQIFEGLTEYVVQSDLQSNTDSTQQKGEFGAGRLMAEIIETNNTKSEKRFLHNYAYTLFEDALLNGNKVLEITPENIEQQLPLIDEYSFVKVTNRIAFNDSKRIEDLIKNFNEIGLSLTSIIHQNSIAQLTSETQNAINNIKDRNEKSRAQQKLKNKSTLKDLARASNMQLDEDFLRSLGNVLDFGYEGSFEIHSAFETKDDIKLFSCNIDRDLLIESDKNIIRKYSRETEKEFTIFGIPTQTKSIKKDFPLYKNIENGSSLSEPTFKEAMMNMIAKITGVESAFNGKLNYEYVIDPIAIYKEL